MALADQVSRQFVYVVPDDLLPVSFGVEALEVLVNLSENPRTDPEVCIRPTAEGQPLTIWSEPLELVRRGGA